MGAEWLQAIFWPLATVVAYLCARTVQRRYGYWWSSALVMAPVLLLALAGLLHADYAQYMRGSHWLMAMLSPVIVAFALPLYQERAMIRRYWPILLVGVAVGSALAGVSAWLLASWLGVPDAMRLSLLPRSVATPFAMPLSARLGGIPDLTAVFVILTGVIGALMGQPLRRLLRLRSALARGALFGMGAHGAGVAKAREIAADEGAIAGLVMVLAGLCNILVTPAVVYLLLR
ncbi:murein hydrolase effector protein LrgB [Bordetella trematum]|uniref:Inner membrane protein yohK n=1 Tax=Bordetella trematum TaxID=123899 RepID=A0A157R7J8_9BORD|nr:LrgB family protein [Bordetella trematum]AZR93089.1 murein hydrolase effector protein LrgB [Bordetella trematum]NNH19341.1 LrgB family protein [Bordetella trematum]QIM71689.1 LrgB family protein [Bordetella trematum]SAI53784.1 Inner membrane protein yohK [Bordetella trematum]SAI59213.1 Inner membrane protein yohK [Bordetella trematum]